MNNPHQFSAGTCAGWMCAPLASPKCLAYKAINYYNAYWTLRCLTEQKKYLFTRLYDADFLMYFLKIITSLKMTKVIVI